MPRPSPPRPARTVASVAGVVAAGRAVHFAWSFAHGCWLVGRRPRRG